MFLVLNSGLLFLFWSTSTEFVVISFKVVLLEYLSEPDFSDMLGQKVLGTSPVSVFQYIRKRNNPLAAIRLDVIRVGSGLPAVLNRDNWGVDSASGP